jgi:ribosome-associated protein
MDEKLAKDIQILKISNVSVIADYFILGSAASNVQVNALSGNITEILKKKFYRTLLREETDSRNRWHLLDYGDVVVHVMHQEERAYYALEKFWSHAQKINQDQWMQETKDINLND